MKCNQCGRQFFPTGLKQSKCKECKQPQVEVSQGISITAERIGTKESE